MNFSHKFKKTRSYTKYWQDGTLTAEVMEFFRTNDPRTYTLEQLSDKTGIPNYILSKWRKTHTHLPLTGLRPSGKCLCLDNNNDGQPP